MCMSPPVTNNSTWPDECAIMWFGNKTKSCARVFGSHQVCLCFIRAHDRRVMFPSATINFNSMTYSSVCIELPGTCAAWRSPLFLIRLHKASLQMFPLVTETICWQNSHFLMQWSEEYYKIKVGNIWWKLSGIYESWLKWVSWSFGLWKFEWFLPLYMSGFEMWLKCRLSLLQSILRGSKTKYGVYLLQGPLAIIEHLT